MTITSKCPGSVCALEGVLNEDLQKSDHIDACRTGRPVGGAGLVMRPVW
jgi:hypothetical protein